jgi:hypothetical protein
MVTYQLLIGLLKTSAVKSLLIGWLNKDLQNSKGAPGVGRPSLLRCLSQWELLSKVNKSIYSTPFTCSSYRVFILPFEVVDVWRIPYFPGLLTIRCEVHSNLVQYEQWLDLTSILPFSQIWPYWVFGLINAGDSRISTSVEQMTSLAWPLIFDYWECVPGEIIGRPPWT